MRFLLAAHLRRLVRVGFVATLAFAALSPLACSSSTSEGGALSAPLVKGLPITEVALFQGVKVPLTKDGAPVANTTPIVAGRVALIRVYVKPDGDYVPVAATAEATVTVNGVVTYIRDEKTLEVESKDALLASTFNLDIPAELVQPGMTVTVALKTQVAQATGSTEKATSAKLGPVVSTSPERFRLKVIPFRYDADRSGRLPDVSEAQLEVYRKRFMSLYPAREVEITVGDPEPITTSIRGNGTGLQQALQAMQKRRARDKPGKDVYYYGAFAPNATFDAYCGGGCVTGVTLQPGGTASIEELRFSVGVGYSGQNSVDTAVHEISHAHLRKHANCDRTGGMDPRSIDPKYPYTKGQLGAWGYDMFDKSFKDPTTHSDYMGYCANQWTSDYTFGALFTEMIFVSGAVKDTRGTMRTAYRQILVDVDKSMTVGESVVFSGPLDSDKTVVRVSRDGVWTELEGQFIKMSHLDAGVLYIPEATWHGVQALMVKHPLVTRDVLTISGKAGL